HSPLVSASRGRAPRAGDVVLRALGMSASGRSGNWVGCPGGQPVFTATPLQARRQEVDALSSYLVHTPATPVRGSRLSTPSPSRQSATRDPGTGPGTQNRRSAHALLGVKPLKRPG